MIKNFGKDYKNPLQLNIVFLLQFLQNSTLSANNIPSFNNSYISID